MKFLLILSSFALLLLNCFGQKSVSYDGATKDVYPTGLNLSGGSTTNTVFKGVLAPITAYGAVGNGTTDNAAFIETALASGNPIFIPEGVFKVSSEVDVPSGARIYGKSGSILLAGSTAISVLKLYDVDNVIVQGVEFRGASNNAAASSAAGNAVYITQGSTQVKLSNLDVRYFNTGVFANVGSSDILIDGCTFVGNARAAINPDTALNGRAVNNLIDGTRTGIGDGLLQQVGVWLQKDSLYWTVGFNNISNLRAEAINVKGRHNVVIGNVLNTVDNGIIFETDSADVTDSNHGSYNSAVANNITNVTGVGIFGGNTIGVNNAVVHHLTVSGNNISGAEYGLSFAGLNSSATNERPYALTVVGNVVNATTVGTALGINANDSVFANNILRGAYTDAIQLYRGTNNVIEGNHIYGPRNNGIYLFTGGLNNVVRGNSIFGGSASAANTYDGLRVANQTNAVVSGNFVYGSDWRYLLNDESSNVGSAWRENTPSGSYGTSPFNFSGSGSTRLNNSSGTLAVNDSTGRVGINTQSPRSTAGGQSAGLHYVGRNILFGGDTDTTEADDASKVARISTPPRDTTAGVDVTMFQYDGGAANNVLTIGGGTSANYAMSRIVFNTGSGVSTTAGTERMRVDGSGNVSIGTAADAGAKLEVGGSALLAYTGSLVFRDSGGTGKTAVSYTDGSGVIVGNGSTGVRITGGSNGISLGQSGTTSPVSVARKNSADATTNLVDSNQLKLTANIWDGASGVDRSMSLANFATGTNGPAHYFGLTDSANNLLLAVTNSSGNTVVTGSLKASGGLTGTTVNGNTISAGTGTLGLGSATVTFSEGFALDGTATGQGIRFDGSAWGASALFAMTDTANAWSDGVTQTFNPNGTSAGINVGTVAGDPSSLNNGDMWYDSSGATALKARIGGATVTMASKEDVFPNTQTVLAYSGTTVTATVGGRKEYAHLLTLTNHVTSFTFSGAVMGDRGLIELVPAATNITLTLASPARSQSGATLTITAAGSTTNTSCLAWQAVGTNVWVTLGSYYR